MEINNINNINFIKKASKKHINNKNENPPQHAQKSVVNPNYYQAVNKISFKSNSKPIQYTIQDGKYGKELLTNSKFGPLTLDDYTLDYYILNPDGSVNKERLEEFINIFNKFYEEMNAEADEDISFFQSKIDESTSGIIQFPVSDELFRQTIISDLSSDVSDSTLSKHILSFLSGDDKKEFTERILNMIKQHKSEIKDNAIRHTERIFEFSKTNDGSIDLSDLDRKKQLSDMIEYYEYNFNKEDSIAELQKYAKKSDGTLDLDLAIGTMDIIKSSEILYSISEIAPVIKHFYDKDPDNKPEIFSTLKSISKSDFSISEKDSYLKDLMELCFDKDGKFNVTKKDIILNLVEEAGNWINDKMNDFDSYPIYVHYAFNFITDYLDGQGENILSPTQDITVNFREYIEHRMRNITII